MFIKETLDLFTYKCTSSHEHMSHGSFDSVVFVKRINLGRVMREDVKLEICNIFINLFDFGNI